MNNVRSVEIKSIGYGRDIVTESLFHDYMDKIYKQKDLVLKCRMAELGINIDIAEEAKKRFKSISIETNGDEQTYYFNDGSINGLRIITFITEFSKPLTNGNSCSVGAEIKYY